MWDVQASCERAGSLDSAIRNPEVNDFKLPSTRPANASWSFERKRAVWREVMAATALV